MSLLKGLAEAALNAALKPQGAQQGGGGVQALMGLAAQNPQLMQAAAGLLANDSAVGGLQGLMARFQQAGLGDAAQSWVGTGANQPVNAAQIETALGADTVQALARSAGVAPGAASGLLAQVLPEVINQLTPSGQAPARGVGGQDAVMQLLGGLLRR